MNQEICIQLGIEPFLHSYHRWYMVPKRAYHTLSHACHVMDQCYYFCRDDPALILAAMYHDAVYISGSDINEKSSALALMHDARTIQDQGYTVDLDMVRQACVLINQTTIKDHLRSDRVTDIQLATLLDADLHSLSYPYDEFLENQENILKENFLPPYVNNMRELAKFLKQFLECREWIYHNDYCRVMDEYAAKENIKRFCSEFGVIIDTSKRN